MSKFKVLFLYPNEPFLNPPPISIGVLSAILKKNSCEVDLFDTTFYESDGIDSDAAKVKNLQARPFSFKERGIEANKGDLYSDLRAKVKEFKPDLIALSVLEGTYKLGIKMLEAIKDYNLPVVAGGVFATAAPEILLSNPYINMVCIGEGETALLELCRKMSEGKDYTAINNLWLKDGNGRIIKNSLGQVASLNELPVPDYAVFDHRRLYRPMAGKVYRMVPLETNRGCPFQCSFCNSPATAKLYKDNHIKNYFRKKSIQKIYEELRSLITTWKAEYLYFSSDTFLAMSDNEFEGFIEAYSEFKLPFWIQTRPETVNLKRMLKLKSIGCHRISMGIEHGNPGFRAKVLCKKFKNKTVIKATKLINKAGIPLTVNNIIGFPFETRKLIFDTIELNREIEFDTCNAYAFYPFKGTELHKVCSREKLIKKGLPPLRCVTLGSILDMPQLSNKEIEGLLRTFVLYVRMPKRYWKEIRRAEIFDDKGDEAFERLRNICSEKYLN